MKEMPITHLLSSNAQDSWGLTFFVPSPNGQIELVVPVKAERFAGQDRTDAIREEWRQVLFLLQEVDISSLR